MKYYASMTLADYLAVNWLSMDPDLVRLIEIELDKTGREISSLQEDVDDWQENYSDLQTQARGLVRDITTHVDWYTGMNESVGELITNIRHTLDRVDFD